MHFNNTVMKTNQTSRFAKILIVLTLFVAAVAAATLYQDSASPSPNAAIPALAARGNTGTELVQPYMQGEPFSPADGVNSISAETAPTKKVSPDLASLNRSPTRAQANSTAERQFMLKRLDHSVVSQHATAHDSDAPGASIGAY